MAHSPGRRIRICQHPIHHLPQLVWFYTLLQEQQVDKFGSPKSPMGWGLKRLEKLIQNPLENPKTFLLFDVLRRISHHIGLLMMIRSTSTSLVSA
jgi:hypothetical protein